MAGSNPLERLGCVAAAIAALAVTLSLGAAAAAGPGAGVGDENARVADWRSKRLASLTSETGWLTPAVE